MPKPSLPVRLVLLVAGTTLPLIVFAVGFIFHDYLEDRKAATERVLQTVRSIRLTLDAEMQRMTDGLQVLAMTDRLKNGDFDGFRRIALGFLDQYAKGGVMLVSDREGHMLFSSLTPDTASLPIRNNREIVEQVFLTKRPQYSNLFFGAAKKTTIVTVEVPVLGDGEVIYDISFTPPLEMFQNILEGQRPSADWTLSILDSNGIVFGRVPNPPDSFGKRAAASVLSDMLHRSEAVQPTVSLEGTSLMLAFGPVVPLSPRLAVVLSMIVHEIATNAAKYGALSNDNGTITVDWEVLHEEGGPKLRLIWTETGGPPVTAPVQRGFGSRMIERSARDQLGGEATVDFLPRGVVCTLTCALERDG